MNTLKEVTVYLSTNEDADLFLCSYINKELVIMDNMVAVNDTIPLTKEELVRIIGEAIDFGVLIDPKISTEKIISELKNMHINNLFKK